MYNKLELVNFFKMVFVKKIQLKNKFMIDVC